MNIGKKDNNFVLYTKYPNKNKRIRDISQFFEKYSKGKYYVESHHPKFQDLPDVIKPRAEEAVRLSEKLIDKGIRALSKEELEKLDLELRKLNL